MTVNDIYPKDTLRLLGTESYPWGKVHSIRYMLTEDSDSNGTNKKITGSFEYNKENNSAILTLGEDKTCGKIVIHKSEKGNTSILTNAAVEQTVYFPNQSGNVLIGSSYDLNINDTYRLPIYETDKEFIASNKGYNLSISDNKEVSLILGSYNDSPKDY
jgi:hypothetical protein